MGKILSICKGNATLQLNRTLNNGDGIKIIYNGEEVGGFAINNIEKVGKKYIVKNFGDYPVGS
ncbi:MAG: hypothetical protein K2H24_02645, partial [Clostridia bacterium]|nr:hypothetical protein [Clostridia bacterium]